MFKDQLVRGSLVVKRSLVHGYGVFADQDFEPNEIIEDCYYIQTTTTDDQFMDYYFYVDEKNSSILLGYGSIYNHSSEPNTYIYRYTDAKLFTIFAKKRIKKGEEIFINYGKKWFTTREREMRDAPHVKWRKRLQTGLFFIRFLIIASVIIATITCLKMI